jgi:predicted nucleic acid-binding protein
MICLDTSSLIAFLAGDAGNDVEAVDQALQDQEGIIAPVTLTELLSDPKLPRTLRETIFNLPVLHVTEGYWERAGLTRAKILRAGRKAKLADTLIAQSCIDHRVMLVTRDKDFQAFNRLTGLKLLGV